MSQRMPSPWCANGIFAINLAFDSWINQRGVNVFKFFAGWSEFFKVDMGSYVDRLSA